MTETPPYLQRFVLPIDVRTPDRAGALDFYRPDQDGQSDRRVPAILFVHGGPGGPDLAAAPRDWPVFQGYGSAAVERGVVGAVVDHALIDGLDQLPTASDEVEAAVGLLRADPQVDPERIALWFFSGSGLLAGEWLDSQPEWLRCVALTYPRLTAPAGTPELISAIEVIGKRAELPVLLVRAGLERDDLAGPVEDFVAAAEGGAVPLDVLDVPNGRHGFDMLDHTDESLAAVTAALAWTLGHLTGAPTTLAPTKPRPRRTTRPKSSAEARPATQRTAPKAPAEPVRSVVDESSAPAKVVGRHLAAYAARDLNAFLDTFAPNAQVHRLDGVVVSGRRALREHYTPMFADSDARVEVFARITEGDWVVDHQVVHGTGPDQTRLIAVHQVQGDHLLQVRFLV